MAWVVGVGIFLFLLFSFPRQVGALVGLAVVVVGGWLGYLWYSGKQQDALKAQIYSTVNYQQTCKDDKYPLFIGFVNRSPRSVTKVFFSVAAKLPGHSDSVYYTSDTTDRILAPGASGGDCWRLADYALRKDRIGEFPLANLNWSIDYSSPTFD